MRFAVIILVTIVVALGASWLIWRDRLTPPTGTTLPKPPTELQRQFGMRVSPPLAAALERPLPATFQTGGSLRWTVDRLREVAGAEIIVNWRSLHSAGVDERAKVDAAMAGRPLREALPALIAAVATREPIGIEADNNVLIIDVQSQLASAITTRVYDVRDLLPPPPITPANPAPGQLIAAIQAGVAPGTWRTPGQRRIGAIQHLSGQLIVTHTPIVQYDLALYLNELRIARARREFAQRTTALIGASIAAVLAFELIRRLLRQRAARRAGLCQQCGYDLRASEGRCPECGTEFTPAASGT